MIFQQIKPIFPSIWQFNQLLQSDFYHGSGLWSNSRMSEVSQRKLNWEFVLYQMSNETTIYYFKSIL